MWLRWLDGLVAVRSNFVGAIIGLNFLPCNVSHVQFQTHPRQVNFFWRKFPAKGALTNEAHFEQARASRSREVFQWNDD
jgi:hypothetical protein